MEKIDFPIRDALRNQGMKQEDLAKKIGTSRQTVSNYLSQYEKYGTLSNSAAKAEFDRIMLLEKQRLMGLAETGTRKERAEARKTVIDELKRKKCDNQTRYERFLRRILSKYPNITMYDWEKKPVSLETLDLNEMWVNDCDNEQLLAVLTSEEKAEWDEIQQKDGEILRDWGVNGRMEEAYILENLWDATIPEGRPMIYDDVFECAITEEEAEAELYNFHCESFCLCNGNTARIYAENLYMPGFEHDMELDVLAIIELITEKGLYYYDTVKLESRFPGRYAGQIDNLIPGYKYVYSLSITGDADEVNNQEYTLREGYNAINSHPLK